MLPGRWDEIERLYQAAIERPPHERAAFLAQACGSDDELRQEVASLLEHDRDHSSLLGTMRQALAADLLTRKRVAETERESIAAPVERPRAAALPHWALFFVAVAALRTAAGLVVYFSGGHSHWRPAELPYGVYAALTSTFTAVGMALILANRRDQRAAWLGGLYVLVVTPLASPLLQDFRWAQFIRPEAMGAPFLWRFLLLFPSPLEGRARRFIRIVAEATTVVGSALFTAHLIGLLSQPMPPAARVASNLHWLVTFGMDLPALPLLLRRSAAATGQARRRAALFARGMLVGFAPITIEVLLQLSPAYMAVAHSPAIEPIVATIVFGAMGIVPILTAYSVLYDRVVETRVVLRDALQYAFARYTILAVTLVPFAALALYLFTHRTEPIAALMTGPRPLILGGFGAGGLLALRLRTDWLHRVNRRYFREPYDVRDVLARVVGEAPPTSSAELASRLRDEVGQALHADLAVFLVDERRAAMHHVAAAEDRLTPLSVSATLTDLVLADARPMDVTLDDRSSPLSRLPGDEQEWLRRGQFCLLVGLRRAGGAAAGLLALTPKQSGLPFSADDRRLLAMLASTAGLALDSLRLASTPDSSSAPAARECPTCSRIRAAHEARCVCGGLLIEAAVPHVLRDVFRLEERIGAGGMGVVYRAVDLHLNRDVAIKALPHVTPAGVARLRREAQAMAAVTHPNLAVIYGIETWQQTPFLVQEYLGGGTLARRLGAATPPVVETLTLGITLAELLHHLHSNGVIHCDVKPSNIGFTQHNVVKLLDFGLARVLRDLAVVSVHPTLTFQPAGGAGPRAIFGTPQFMSPEAVRGETPTALVDLWALSVVIYQALTGQLPFNGPHAEAIFACILTSSPPDPRQQRPELSDGLTGFFQTAFAREPAQRPASGAEMASTFRRLLVDHS